MLSYFPNLYPDELLYSWFARYHDHSGNTSSKQTMKELFGNMSSVAVADFPNNLEAFYKNISHFNPPNINDLVTNHTLYNYYTAFQSDVMKSRAFNYITNGGKPGAIHMFLGIVASTIKNWHYLRFCPSCVQQDRERYGEAYWHMSHQLPKVFYCYLHQEFLHDSTIEFRNPHKHEFISVEKTELLSPCLITVFSPKLEQQLKKLSDESINLIRYAENTQIQDFSQIYKYLMQVNGYANHFGKVHQQYFTQQFKKYYREEFLALVDCNFDEHSDTAWLRNIVRKHRKAFHPVQHLLLIQFLNVSFKDLENYLGKKYEAFGQAPYYCLNPAADHYKKRVISNVAITTCTDTRKPVGTFSCDCGFVYSRRGPDIDKSDALKVGRIKDFGPVWQTKLMQLVTSELSPYRIAQLLDCDYATVKKYMSISKGEPSNHSEQLMDSSIQKEIEWINLVETYSDYTVTQLRKINPALYAWHYRNNRDWLKENSPRIKGKVTSNNRVDWEKRDLEILRLVKKAIKDLYAIEKPIYVNKSRVAKKMGQLSSLEKQLDKLPKTKAYLNKNLETREQFQIRRIKWACKKLYMEDRNNVVVWKVRRLAGLKEKTSNIIEIALENEIRLYQQGEMQNEIKTMDF
ncbi:TniQ family protein [Staphylococcus sciuri]|uniref:TnsD family Tn7-like transposition protein n=1 Tax=Mammaliicoccus sciuri TaxID=1296 RepID=UPI0015D0CDB3|nr:TnsD family Tn7-like transposition protein [Mammaliicoccus sciuri]MBF0719106.1 TnsD family transposase [Mammaliicoccus sciuri]NYS37867.1 TniQ family protein [Mammaliicoccus sciuri]